MVWVGGLDSVYARVAFTFIATVLFALLALAAAACYEASIRRHLLKGESLRIVYAIGWLRGTSVFTAWRKTGQLPGGLWYTVMLFIALAGYTAHLLNSAIVAWPAYSQCTFDQGLVLGSRPIMINPSWNTLSFTWTQTAQSYMGQGCASGILNKVPTNDNRTLCPQSPDIPMYNTRSDVLGSWVCAQTANKTFPLGSSDTAIATTSISDGHLYPVWRSWRWTRELNGNSTEYNQIILWSTSAYGANATGHTWDVKFGIEYNGSWSSQTPDMRYYTCSLNIAKLDTKGLLKTIMTTINTTSVLSSWNSALPGVLYYGTDSSARADAGDQMSYILNSMFMISGSGDYLYSTAQNTTDSLYGCTGIGSEIPNYVLGFLAVAFALAFFFAVWWVVLKIQIHRLNKNHNKELRLLPTDQCDWAARAAYASERAASLATKASGYSTDGTILRNNAEDAGEEDSMFAGDGQHRSLQKKKDWTKSHLKGRRMRADAGHIIIYKEGGIQDGGHGTVSYSAHPNKPQ